MSGEFHLREAKKHSRAASFVMRHIVVEGVGVKGGRAQVRGGRQKRVWIDEEGGKKEQTTKWTLRLMTKKNRQSVERTSHMQHAAVASSSELFTINILLYGLLL